MGIHIIVNADDLGASEAINDAIFRGMERGVITSATMFPNGPATAAAIRRSRHFPECSFGVHLNLTQFEPLCAESIVTLSSLLDQCNCFDPKAIRSIDIRLPLLRAIYREWCAQIESVMRLGVKPSHLDTHQHVHTIPRMLSVLSALRRRFHINKVRISRNMYDTNGRPSSQLLSKKWLYNHALRVIGFKTTQTFTDLETFVRLCSVQRPPWSVIELSTHPGSEGYAEERRLLESDWLHKLSYSVTLVSYNEL